MAQKRLEDLLRDSCRTGKCLVEQEDYDQAGIARC